MHEKDKKIIEQLKKLLGDLPSVDEWRDLKIKKIEKEAEKTRLYTYSLIFFTKKFIKAVRKGEYFFSVWNGLNDEELILINSLLKVRHFHVSRFYPPASVKPSYWIAWR